MKVVKYILLTLLVLIVAAFVAAWLYMEPLVKGVVNKFGTQVVGTNVTLGGFKLNPFDGVVEVRNLAVANPTGYSAPNLLELGGIKVKVDPKSLLSDTIVVEDVTVSKPMITYEMPDFSTSNVMQIQQNVAKNTASEEKAEVAEEKTEESEGSSKNVIIRKVLVEGGALSAITPVQKHDTALELTMPAVEIAEIGGEGQKVTVRESITTIFNKILFNATSVVTKALGNAKQQAKKAAMSALDETKNAADSVKEESKGLLDNVKFW